MKLKGKSLAIGFLIACVGLFAVWEISKSRSFQAFGEIVPRVNTSQKVVALTFDDGPAIEATDRILAELKELNVRATFFLTGAELEQNPSEGRKIALAGHEIGNHSYSHQRMSFVTPSFVEREIEDTDRQIRTTGYSGAIHFRPPYGRKLFVLPFYLSKTNRKTITWDIEPDSYPKVAESSDKIARHVAENVQPGSIILLHIMYESRQTSLEAVRKIVGDLQSGGYRFVTVSELIEMK